MNELALIGVLELGIGGGEPLCHPELYSLLSYAHTLDLNTIVTTNGLLVTDEIASRLKETGVFEVRVSFDGSEAVHDSIRGAGVYKKALSAATTLKSAGVRMIPRVTLCKDDPTGLDNLFRDLKSTGATLIKAAMVEPTGRASLPQNRDLFKYNRDNITSSMLIKLAQKYDIKLTMPSDLAACPELADGGELRLGKIKGCGAGLECAYISPSGKVLPCSGTPEITFGEIKNNSFMDIWMNEPARKWRKQARDNGPWCICLQKPKLRNS